MTCVATINIKRRVGTALVNTEVVENGGAVQASIVTRSENNWLVSVLAI